MKRLTVALVAVLAVLGMAPSAWAQAELTDSDPAEGAELADPPTKITLTFSEPVDPDLAVISVAGADGILWTVGEVSATDSALTMTVTPSGPAGRCTISYNIASDDDPASGSVKFTLAKPVPAPSNPPTTTPVDATSLYPASSVPDDSGGGLPLWVWVVIGAVVVGLALGAVTMRRGGTRPPAKS